MKFIVAVIFTLGLAAGSAAQSPSIILKRAEKALGGVKALRSVRSMVQTGTIKSSAEGISGKYVLHTSQPDLMNISYDLDGFETEMGFNGRSGWARNSRDGLRTLTGSAGVDFQAKALFRNNLWIRHKDDKAKITSGGKTVIEGKSVNVVIMTTRRGQPIRLSFDAASGLPVREEMPSGGEMEIVDLGDYRAVDGVNYPFFSRITRGEQTYEIQVDEVKVNQTVPRSVFDFPVASNAPLPDIPALLRELQTNQDRLEAILENYSYNQKITQRERDKTGSLREKGSETFQLSFYKGNRIRRLIEKNGRPLSEKDQADVDKDAAKQVEEIENKIAKREARLAKEGPNAQESEENRRLSIAEVLRASRLINPRRERFRGREVVVFDFEPNPAFNMKNEKTAIKVFGKTAGVMWIDEKDKQVVRLEAVLLESFKIGGGLLAKLNKGATFIAEQERVNDEIWLPSVFETDISVRVLLVKGINMNQLVRSYDYRRFETEVKDAKIDAAKTP